MEKPLGGRRSSRGLPFVHGRSYPRRVSLETSSAISHEPLPVVPGPEVMEIAVEDARSILLSLGIALRSIGKSTSVDRMEELEREYPAVEHSLMSFAEVLPRQVGRMLSDLVHEAAPADTPGSRRLLAEVYDPRSFREAADAVDLVAELAPEEVVLAYSRIPEDRWPREAIRDAGLFFLGLVLRGVHSIRRLDGRFHIADASVDLQQIDRARKVVLDWHRAFATAAARSSSAELSPRASEASLSVYGLVEVRPTELEKSLLLSEEQARNLSSFVRFCPGDAPDDLVFRQRVAASLHLFLRLLQRPYAAFFQETLSFCPTEGQTSFCPPSTIVVGQDGDLWQVVAALGSALDLQLGGYLSPASASGPARAFGESVAVGTGLSPEEGFVTFLVAYLGVLCVQQGIVKPEDAPQTWVDRKMVGRMHAQFLEILLERQRSALFQEGVRIGQTRTRGLVEGGVGAATLPLLAWALPRVR